MVVGVELLRTAEEGRRAAGRIVEVIGPADAPETDLKAVIRKYGLREEFPPDVLEQAERAPGEVRPADLAGREDFRALPVVTIDGETAMDFDDAVLVRRNGDGTYELQVHVADVAHYVKPSTPLDREALERATSTYFPGFALPMLPHRLSNGLCSLNPGQDRLVQSCLMTIDSHGHVGSYRLVEGVIRSAARMTYTHVAGILKGDADLAARYQDLVPGFRLMEELCGILNTRRRRRGSIDFDLPEPEVILAATGEMVGITALERNVAHRIIEEFMLAANETVARHLWKARVPSLYRVHERPDPRRLEEFDVVSQAFGYVLPRPFTSIEPGAFQAILERAKGRPEERFLSRLMLRSMKQARYSERRDIHFGLASRCYTHFTSPIRRYPDLVVHRLVKRMLRGGPIAAKERADLEDFLPEAAARSSLRERTADAAENELVDRKKLAFMGERLGEEFDGFVSGIEPFGAFVELRDLFVEGLVPIASLADDRYRYDERRRVLRGERRGRVIALGDPARVRVDKVDRYRLEIDFSLVASESGPRPAGPIRAHGDRGRPERGRPERGRPRRGAPPERRRGRRDRGRRRR
jgi:ribonuclease R